MFPSWDWNKDTIYLLKLKTTEDRSYKRTTLLNKLPRT